MSPPSHRSISGALPQPGPCVPVAHLAVATAWIGGDEQTLAAIRLDFDYGGVVVRSAARTSRVRRDPVAEVQARRLLEGLGAIELGCLDDIDTDGTIDYAVRLDHDVHALCGFSAYALPQLRALGWRIDVDPAYPWQTLDDAAAIHATVNPR